MAAHMGVDFGPVTIYLYQVAMVLAAIFLMPASRARRSSYVLPGMFLATMVCWAVVGFAVGNPTDRALREFLYLFEHKHRVALFELGGIGEPRPIQYH